MTDARGLTTEDIIELAANAFIKAQKKNRSDQGRGHPDLGRVLEAHMNDAGYSQSELAKIIGRHQTFIGKVIAGQRGISIETLAQLDDVLGDGFTFAYLSVMRRIARQKATE